jgi:salicylate hydroxylase
MAIAIVGAGIGGCTLAAALHAVGIDCTVYEQAPALNPIGAGIQVAPNAARPLLELGLGPFLSSSGVRVSAIHMRRWDSGETISKLPLAECPSVFGAPYYTLLRADLHDGLVGLLPPGTLRLGRPVVAVHDGPSPSLEFADGGRVHADLVVGADGIHSVVRAGLHTDEPRFSGQLIFRGLVPADRVSFLTADPRVQLFLGPGKHCVSYPVAAGSLVSFGATIPGSSYPFASAFAESWSSRGDVRELAAAYGGWYPEVRKLIEAADTAGLWALHDRDPITGWSGQRTTLLGDAAHPMLPFMAQGANQAIEDAIVLARCLSRYDVDAALVRYEEIRRPRTEDVQTRSRGNNRTLHLTDEEREQGLAPAELRSQEWLFGYDASEVAI